MIGPLPATERAEFVLFRRLHVAYVLNAAFPQRKPSVFDT